MVDKQTGIKCARGRAFKLRTVRSESFVLELHDRYGFKKSKLRLSDALLKCNEL